MCAPQIIYKTIPKLGVLWIFIQHLTLRKTQSSSIILLVINLHHKITTAQHKKLWSN